MDQDPDQKSHRSALRWAVFFVLVTGLAFATYQALFHAKTPLPDAWNPTQGLRISDPVTPLTLWKMRRALASDASCLAVLGQSRASIEEMPDLEGRPGCGIEGRVTVRGVGQSRMVPVETRCAIALRMAMWERHGLQPAADRHFGQKVSQIRHLSSYNCRKIRTPQGAAQRMSTHATADAIDVTGFDLADGTEIRLNHDWAGRGKETEFLRDARDSACTWFRVTLGPDYNRLHADHFHLQNTGWGLCR